MKIYPQISNLTYLKCLTIIHINYVVFSYIDILNVLIHISNVEIKLDHRKLKLNYKKE
jgi:hypothetical protein